MEAEQIFLPQGDPLLDVIENELLAFPNGSQHDDIVDVLSYACIEVIKRGGSGESADDRAAREEREREEEKKRQEAWLQPTNPMLWR